MPRCKNETCKRKFIAKYFLQKTCSKTCQDEFEGQFEQTSLNEMSEKRKEQEKLYSKISENFKYLHPDCECCGKKATDIHHKNGRNGDRLNDSKYFMSVCRICHTYIHEHPQEARENGYLV